VAAKDFPSIPAAMGSLSRVGARVEPAGDEVAQYHDAKYQVFQRMYRDQLAYRRLMSPVVIDKTDVGSGLGDQEDTR
jgi:ribulose kinase